MPEQYHLFVQVLYCVISDNPSFFMDMTLKFTPHSTLQHVHSLFQSEFFTKCDLMLSVSNFSILSFLKVIQQLLTSSSSSYRLFYLSCNNVFQKAVAMQCVANPTSLPLFQCMQDIPFLFLSVQHLFIFRTIGPTDLHPSPASYFKTFNLFLIQLNKDRPT